MADTYLGEAADGGGVRGGLQGGRQGGASESASQVSGSSGHALPVPLSLCSLAHELRVSCMQRKKVQIQSSDPSALASDRFNLILVSGRELPVGARGTALNPDPAWLNLGFHEA